MKHKKSRNETLLISLIILIILIIYVTYVPIAITKELNSSTKLDFVTQVDSSTSLNQKCSKTELYIKPNDQGSLQ